MLFDSNSFILENFEEAHQISFFLSIFFIFRIFSFNFHVEDNSQMLSTHKILPLPFITLNHFRRQNLFHTFDSNPIEIKHVSQNIHDLSVFFIKGDGSVYKLHTFFH